MMIYSSELKKKKKKVLVTREKVKRCSCLFCSEESKAQHLIPVNACGYVITSVLPDFPATVPLVSPKQSKTHKLHAKW